MVIAAVPRHENSVQVVEPSGSVVETPDLSELEQIEPTIETSLRDWPGNIGDCAVRCSAREFEEMKFGTSGSHTIDNGAAVCPIHAEGSTLSGQLPLFLNAGRIVLVSRVEHPGSPPEKPKYLNPLRSKEPMYPKSKMSDGQLYFRI